MRRSSDQAEATPNTKQRNVLPGQASAASPPSRRRAPLSSPLSSPASKARNGRAANAIADGVQDKASSSAGPLGPGLRRASTSTNALRSGDGADASAGAGLQGGTATGSQASPSPPSKNRSASKASAKLPSSSPQTGAAPMSPLPLPLQVNSTTPTGAEGEQQDGFYGQGVSTDANGNEHFTEDASLLAQGTPPSTWMEEGNPAVTSAPTKLETEADTLDQMAESLAQDMSDGLMTFKPNPAQAGRGPPNGSLQQLGQGQLGTPYLGSMNSAQGKAAQAAVAEAAQAQAFGQGARLQAEANGQGVRGYSAVRDSMGQEPLNVSIELGQELVRRNRLLEREVKKLREMAAIPFFDRQSGDELTMQGEKPADGTLEWHVERGMQLSQELTTVCQWAEEAGNIQRYVSQVLLGALQGETSISQEVHQALVKLVAFPPPPPVRSIVTQGTTFNEVGAGEDDSISQKVSSAKLRIEVERRLEHLTAEARKAHAETLQSFKGRLEQAEGNVQVLRNAMFMIAKMVPGGESLSEYALAEKLQNMMQDRDARVQHLAALQEKTKKAEAVAKELVVSLVSVAASCFEEDTLPPEFLVLQEAAEQLTSVSYESPPEALTRPSPSPGVVAALEAASAVLESSGATPLTSPVVELREAGMGPYSVTTALSRSAPLVQSATAAQLAGVVSRGTTPVMQSRVLTTEDASQKWRSVTPQRASDMPLPEDVPIEYRKVSPLCRLTRSATDVSLRRETLLSDDASPKHRNVSPMRRSQTMQIQSQSALPPAISVPGSAVGVMLRRSPSPAPEQRATGAGLRSASRSVSPSPVVSMRQMPNQQQQLVSPSTMPSARQVPTQAAVCPTCGSTFMSDSNFCRKCGVKRPQAQEAQPPKVFTAGPSRHQGSTRTLSQVPSSIGSPGAVPQPLLINGGAGIAQSALNDSAVSPVPVGSAQAPAISQYDLTEAQPRQLQRSQTHGTILQDSAVAVSNYMQAYPRSFQAPTERPFQI